MVRRRKAAAPRKLNRNPVARLLRSSLFRVKVVERPDRPRRKPKHPKRLEDEVESDE